MIKETCLVSCKKPVYFFPIGEDAVEGHDDRILGEDGGSLEAAGGFRHSTSSLGLQIGPRKVAFCSPTIPDWVFPEKRLTQEGGKGSIKVEVRDNSRSHYASPGQFKRLAEMGAPGLLERVSLA